MRPWTFLALFLCLVPALATAEEPVDEEVTVNAPAPPGRSDDPAKPQMQLELQDYSLQSADFIFPSGLRVILQEDHSEPLVGITMWVDNGSSSDPLSKEGIAHYVEHLWFKSKHGEGIPMVWDLLQEMGCYLNASTSNDWTNYMTVCSSEFLPIMLKLESLRISDTLKGVTEDEMLTEREVVRNELRMRYEVGGGDFFRHFMADLYPEGHPYHRSTIGTHDSLSNIELSDIQEFVDVNYVPEDTTLVIVGDFDLDTASSMIIENFDLETLHPDLTQDHVFYYPRPGVEEPDKNDPSDWFVGAWSPEAPGEKPLSTTAEPPKRAATKAVEPPTPEQRVNHHQSAIDRKSVVVSWSVPAAYQGKDALWQQAAGTLSFQVWNWFQDPGQRRGLHGDSRIYTDPASGQKAVGCFYMPDTVNSTVVCYAELSSSKVDGERVAADIVDQVAAVWMASDMPGDYQSFAERSFGKARMAMMRDVLLSLDVIASLSGRAFDIAQWAHYTGSPTYHSDMIRAASQGSLQEVQELAYQWLTRDRAAISILTPIPEDEMVLDSSEQAWHGAQSDADVIKRTAVDLDLVTADYIEQQTVTPDVDEMHREVLENGLEVVIMPHGEAPVAKARVVFGGGLASDSTGLFSFAWEHSKAPQLANTELDPLQIAGQFSNGLASNYSRAGILASSKNLDGALWILREWVEGVEPDMAGKRDWIKSETSTLIGTWMREDPAWFVSRLEGEHWNPGHPTTQMLMPEDYERMKGYRGKDVRQLLERLYQPANATLIIVGNVDPEQALAQAKQYFGGWRAAKGTTVGEYGEMPPPNEGAEQRIVLFDKPAETQTEVTFLCPLGPITDDNEMAHKVLGDVMNQNAWQVLREQSGATYGAGASLVDYEGGSGVLYMNSQVQNSATPLAVQTFMGMIEDVEAGEIDHEDVMVQKLQRARQFGLGQQSVEQMTDRLTLGAREGWDYLATYGERLAAVDDESIQQAAQGCTDHALVTMVGPREVVAPLLDEADVDYEVYDWRAEAERLVEQYDPKAYKKWMKSKAEEEAEEETADEGGDDESSEEG